MVAVRLASSSALPTALARNQADIIRLRQLGGNQNYFCSQLEAAAAAARRPAQQRRGAACAAGGADSQAASGSGKGGTKQRMKLVLVVAAALVNDRGEVLLAQRPKGKKLAGMWELPGGKVEQHETPEQALVRELREELGIATEMSAFVPITFASHTYEDQRFHLLMPLYACTRWEGEPHGAEGQRVEWVDEGEMFRRTMPPADEPLLPAVRVLMQRRLAVAAGSSSSSSSAVPAAA